MAMTQDFAADWISGRKAFGAVLSMTVALTFAAMASAQEGGLAGSYAIEGWNPGQDSVKDAPYRGTGTLERRGAEYFYKGLMDGHNYTGVGIYDPKLKSFALHFEEVESGRTGVAQYRYSDGNLSGSWTWADEVEGQLGREVWTAQ